MLYPLQTISEERIPIAPLPGDPVPAGLFLELARTLSRLFGVPPALLRLSGSRTLTLLYRNVAYLLQDVADNVGGLAAALQKTYPLWFCGTTEGRETAEWTISILDTRTALMRLRSVSGTPFDHLEGLGLRLDLPDDGSADALEELCAAVPLLAPCAVIPARGAAALSGSRLLAPASGSRFSYLAWEPLPSSQLLFALTAERKAALWRDFLTNGLQSAEFDWLWELYYTGEPLFLLEWELTLRMVLEDLDFRVERTERSFRITAPSGQIRRFDFARGGPAEKIFLKLLFPLDMK